MKFKYFGCAAVVISLLLASMIFYVQPSSAQRRTVIRTVAPPAADNTPGVATMDDETLRSERRTLSAARSAAKASEQMQSIASWWDRLSGAERASAEQDDPDLPGFMQGSISMADYLDLRAAYDARLRGMDPSQPFNPELRGVAIRKMEQQETLQNERSLAAGISAPQSAWTYIGPSPLANGQTQTLVTPVSGRVTAIDVDPTDANIAYVGTAQGGLYRTTDGGTTWTAMMDAAQSLAIGAVTIDPLDHTKVFVGTGEGNLSLDSFFGVGLYRIDGANGAAPVVNGPFETRVAGTGTLASSGHAFIATAINKIVVDPANDSRIFVGNTLGEGGISGVNYCCGNAIPPSGLIGLYFCANATAATPVFSLVSSAFSGGLQGITDIAIEPGSSNNLLVGVWDFSGGAASGVYRTTNAATSSQAPSVAPTFTNVIALGGDNSKLAINKVGATVTVYAATGTGNGELLKSTDGGATFPTNLPAGTGFCGGQCFYDVAVAVDPTNANTVYLAGNVDGGFTKLLSRSLDGGTTFASISRGLHADAHSIVLAPSNLSTAYFGSDGGVWRSANITTPVNTAVLWNSLNNSTFSATQFESIAVHPTDPKFTIGGTQDNGTELRNPAGTWTRADFGDGGYSLIDQNATDTVNVTMYHTYFNQTNNLLGLARVDTTALASDGNWAFFGCGGTANGISCTDSVNFYAPIALGPGNPNTVYYGSDRLYRSSNKGVTMTVASQAPLVAGQPISTIAIAPGNDNIRMVGLNNGRVFATTTGSSVLTDISTGLPARYVGRAVIDPGNPSIAYVALSGFDLTGASTNFWKTTSLTAAAWTNISGAGGTALPNVPINGIAIDRNDPTHAGVSVLYVGTDIGVYQSVDSGATWAPFGTGLPRVAVFDMAIQQGSRTLRIATHGRGMWEITLPSATTAAGVSVSGRVLSSGGGVRGALVTMTDLHGIQRSTITNAFGYYSFDSVQSGGSFVMRATARRFTFGSRVINVSDTLTDIDFVDGQ